MVTICGKVKYLTTIGGTDTLNVRGEGYSLDRNTLSAVLMPFQPLLVNTKEPFVSFWKAPFSVSCLGKWHHAQNSWSVFSFWVSFAVLISISWFVWGFLKQSFLYMCQAKLKIQLLKWLPKGNEWTQWYSSDSFSTLLYSCLCLLNTIVQCLIVLKRAALPALWASALKREIS